MKRILIIILTLAMLLSLAACKKDPPPATEPVETEPLETLPPATFPEEVVPDIPTETLPPALTDNMTGADLDRLYANFVKDYDWSQHNGFTADTSSILFTYIFGDNCFIKDAKRKSEVYENSYLSRNVVMWKDSQMVEYLMADSGSFGIITPSDINEAPAHPNKWALYNDTTVSGYLRTDISDKIYDIIKVETTWSRGDAIVSCTVKDADSGKTYILDSIKGSWMAYCVEDDIDIEGTVNFNLDAKTLTIGDTTLNVSIVKEPQEYNATEPVSIRAHIYVDRETQKAVYMEDLDRGTRITFLTNAVVDFTMPNNVKMDTFDFGADILYVMQMYDGDMNRYLTAEG